MSVKLDTKLFTFDEEKTTESHKGRMRILKQLIKEDSTAYDLSKKLEMPISTIHKYTSILLEEGYLDYIESMEGGRYKKYYRVCPEYRLMFEMIEICPGQKEPKIVKLLRDYIEDRGLNVESKSLAQEINKETMSDFFDKLLYNYLNMYGDIENYIIQETTFYEDENEELGDMILPYSVLSQALNYTYIYIIYPYLKREYIDDDDNIEFDKVSLEILEGHDILYEGESLYNTLKYLENQKDW